MTLTPTTTHPTPSAAHQGSVEPFPRPDHKAKRHGRPKPKSHYRRAVRQACEAAIKEALGVVL